MDSTYPIRFTGQLRQHLRSLRKRRGLTQAQLGALVGVSQARIAEIEANPSVVSFEQLVQMLSALEVTLSLNEISKTINETESGHLPYTRTASSAEKAGPFAATSMGQLAPKAANAKSAIDQLNTSSDNNSGAEKTRREAGPKDIPVPAAEPDSTEEHAYQSVEKGSVAEQIQKVIDANKAIEQIQKSLEQQMRTNAEAYRRDEEARTARGDYVGVRKKYLASAEQIQKATEARRTLDSVRQTVTDLEELKERQNEPDHSKKGSW